MCVFAVIYFSIFLFQNRIENLNGLSFLVNLRFLMAACNNIQNIRGISDLQCLNFVDLSHNNISDTSKQCLKLLVLASVVAVPAVMTLTDKI